MVLTSLKIISDGLSFLVGLIQVISKDFLCSKSSSHVIGATYSDSPTAVGFPVTLPFKINHFDKAVYTSLIKDDK